MKPRSSISFQYKIVFLFLLLMYVSFTVTGYLAKSFTEKTILREKEAKLLMLTNILDARLDADGFDGILRRAGAENASREEQIRILNNELSGISNAVGESVPGLGVGYYSRDVDAIITYGPESSFAHSVGVTIPEDHPGRYVMRRNVPLIRTGTMVRGDILNAMAPIERHGRVVGYVWANELSTDISTQFSVMTRNLTLIMSACFLLTVALLALLARRTVRAVDRIIKGVGAMRRDISHRIAGVGGELAGVAQNINAMAEDIERANKETSRAMAVLQSVMNNVDAGVYVCDPQTKELIYTNEYLRKALGKNDLEGRPCYAELHGKTGICDFCPQKRLFNNQGEPVFEAHHWEIHNELLKRDFLVMDRLVTWHDGRLLHMEVATDVTERNALAMAEAANLAQREFVARMSHELRTPMNGVLGMTRLALQASPPPAQQEYLKKIEASASLLLGIINDILDFSRIEAGKLSIENQVFDLHETVEGIRELVLPRIQENNLDLTIDIDPSVPRYALGDKLRVSQVLLNLLGNAAKFTLHGGVTLFMKAEESPAGTLRLDCAVADTGIGMDQEQQDALFTPFSQADVSTSRKFGGTGLGLSICKALVELMGGRISVTSEAGKGSTFAFHVLLEPSAGPRDAAEEGGSPWEEARYDGLAFLLVEDNAINQEIAQAVLSDLGAVVDVADNGEEGVQAFMRKDYDVILMDVRMPIMDGLEATRRIRRSQKHDAATVPVIAMTANAMHEDRHMSKEAGMDGHIAKPIDMRELKQTLHAHVGRDSRRVAP